MNFAEAHGPHVVFVRQFEQMVKKYEDEIRDSGDKND